MQYLRRYWRHNMPRGSHFENMQIRQFASGDFGGFWYVISPMAKLPAATGFVSVAICLRFYPSGARLSFICKLCDHQQE